MIGYRKVIIQIFAILAALVLTYMGREAITEQFVAGGTNIIDAIFELIVLWGVPQGGVALYNKANLDAKKILQTSSTAQINMPMAGALYLPSDIVTPSLEAPLDIDKLLEQAEKGRLFKYQFASTKETGLFYAFRDIGNYTATNSLQHCQEYYDKLIELAQISWLAETEKALGGKEGFAWDDKELPINLAKGYSPGCHAMSAYSWARKFNLASNYNLIQNCINNAQWLEALAESYPHIGIVAKLQTNCTLYRVGSLAMVLYQGQVPTKKK